jgi:hypothetical protein
MIKDGTVEVADIKVKGGKRKGYKLRAMWLKRGALPLLKLKRI